MHQRNLAGNVNGDAHGEVIQFVQCNQSAIPTNRARASGSHCKDDDKAVPGLGHGGGDALVDLVGVGLLALADGP